MGLRAFEAAGSISVKALATWAKGFQCEDIGSTGQVACVVGTGGEVDKDSDEL